MISEELTLLKDRNTNLYITTSPVIPFRGFGPKRTAGCALGSDASVDTPSKVEGFIIVSRRKTKNRLRSVTDNQTYQGKNDEQKGQRLAKAGPNKKRRKPRHWRSPLDAVLIKLIRRK